MILNPILPIYIIALLAIFIVALSVFCIIKKKYRSVATLRRILVLVFLLITLLRPSLADGTVQQVSMDVTLFLIIDNSNSMYVEDVNGDTRMSALKKDALKIIKSFPGAHYSILALDKATYTLLPTTTDLNATIVGIDTLDATSSQDSSGSNLNDLIVFAQEGIKQYNKKHPESQNIVVLMSDGETTTDSVDAISFSSFKAVSAGLVLGYGSSEGGVAPYFASYANRGVVKENQYCSSCISKINEDYLQKVASNYHFKYTHSYGDIDTALINNLKDTAKSKIDTSSNKSAVSNTEFYWIFFFFFLVLLLWEFASSFNVILSEYEVKK